MNEIERLDYKIISNIIETGSNILDLGCGGGDLINYLQKTKNVRVQGIELDENEIYKCVAKGLSVFHGDIDDGLKSYPDKTFDYIILNQSLQEMIEIDYVLEESLRVGKKVIIGFPNFAYIFDRIKLFFRGRAPITKNLPYEWHDTPNIRFLSIKDFKDYCRKKKIQILDNFYLGENRKIFFLPNLFAPNAIFVVKK
ncbi:MAG: methionine biosynthesis protein MetW [Elusimicrobia bacterium]|nr:methionine biosynthesis protein MetW [Elusimicrobiota bacterium]